MADDVVKKLDELRRQAQELLERARSIVAQMNTVETIFDLPLTVLSDLETAALSDPPYPPFAGAPVQSIADQRGPLAQPQKRRQSTSIRPDEYFGDEPLEAAKKFMRGVGHAVSFDEITDAVQKGGAATRGADWRDRLEISLKRSPYQVITVADKTYGLAEFYTEEQLKRFRGSRRGEPEPQPKKKLKIKIKRKLEPKPARPAKPQSDVKTEATQGSSGADHDAGSDPVH